jgi:uncharacterized protein (TIGR03083 family)
MAVQTDDYTRPPQDKAELLARIEREWRALERAIAGLSDQQMSVPDTGGWSIKDNLAHLSAWERFMRLSYLHKMPAHEVMNLDPETYRQTDETGMNAILFQRNKDRPVAEVLAGLRDEHARVLDELAKLSFEQMMLPLDPDDPRKAPLMAVIIGNTYDHYREHRITIGKFAAK